MVQVQRDGAGAGAEAACAGGDDVVLGWDQWECLTYDEVKVSASVGMHFKRGKAKCRGCKHGPPTYLVLDLGGHVQEYAHRIVLWALDGPPPLMWGAPPCQWAWLD